MEFKHGLSLLRLDSCTDYAAVLAYILFKKLLSVAQSNLNHCKNAWKQFSVYTTQFDVYKTNYSLISTWIGFTLLLIYWYAVSLCNLYKPNHVYTHPV